MQVICGEMNEMQTVCVYVGGLMRFRLCWFTWGDK